MRFYKSKNPYDEIVRRGRKSMVMAAVLIIASLLALGAVIMFKDKIAAKFIENDTGSTTAPAATGTPGNQATPGTGAPANPEGGAGKKPE